MNRFLRLILLNSFSKWLIWIFRTSKLYFNHKNIIIEYEADIRDTQLETNIKIGERTKIGFSSIKCNTYIGEYAKIYNADIGAYTSIAGGVKIGLGLHPSNTLSTSPIFYSNDGQLPISFVDKNMLEQYKKTRIGNDVWIGQDVIILDGLKIGDGAIIGAGSVVTKDVLPFTIVGGVPAKFIKNRFSDQNIKDILESKWWEFTSEKLKLIKEQFIDENISIALSKLKNL